MIVGTCGCLHHGTVRTDLSKWETYEWEYMGIQMERPVMAPGLSMHYHFSGTLSDGAHGVLIEVEKHTPADFAGISEISPDNPLSRSADHVGWLKWLGTFHSDISERPVNARQKEYRRNIRTKDAIVSINAKYSFAGFTPEEQAADEAAIKRVLLSARPIRETPQQTAPPLPSVGAPSEGR